jgi:hypothetical protein
MASWLALPALLLVHEVTSFRSHARGLSYSPYRARPRYLHQKPIKSIESTHSLRCMGYATRPHRRGHAPPYARRIHRPRLTPRSRRPRRTRRTRRTRRPRRPRHPRHPRAASQPRALAPRPRPRPPSPALFQLFLTTDTRQSPVHPYHTYMTLPAFRSAHATQ